SFFHFSIILPSSVSDVWELTYSSEVQSVIGREHGAILAEVVLQLRLRHPASNRKSAGTLSDIFKAQPHSDTLPTEDVVQIKGVSSSLLQYDHTSSNKTMPPKNATPYELRGVKYIQTTIHPDIMHYEILPVVTLHKLMKERKKVKLCRHFIFIQSGNNPKPYCYGLNVHILQTDMLKPWRRNLALLLGFHTLLVRMTNIKTTHNSRSWYGCGERRMLIAGESANWYSHYGNQ
ncbi:hypothetical protein STEG23_007589, partial [Scotinomys teguina]